MANFEESIHAINKLVFTIGGFFYGYETRTFTLDEERLYMDIEHSFIEKPSNFNIEPDYPLSKEALLDGIRELHISDWRPEYDDPEVLDGTQWELSIHFSNGHRPVKICGSNAHPKNFKKLLALLGMKSGGYENG